MQLKEAYLDRVLGEVEQLAVRVHLLKDRMAKQKVSVRLVHEWELTHVRSLLAEFKWRVEQLEENDDLQLRRDQEAIEATWTDLVRAVDVLFAELH